MGVRSGVAVSAPREPPTLSLLPPGVDDTPAMLCPCSGVASMLLLFPALLALCNTVDNGLGVACACCKTYEKTQPVMQLPSPDVMSSE